jgi:hypothetical protein
VASRKRAHRDGDVLFRGLRPLWATGCSTWSELGHPLRSDPGEHRAPPVTVAAAVRAQDRDLRQSQLIRFPPYPRAKLPINRATIVVAKIRRSDATSSTVQRSITVAEVAERARQNSVGTAPRAQSTGAGPEAKNNDVLQGEMS